MRIVTLNTWKNDGDYERRLGLMAAQLSGLGPDLCLFQEVFSGQGSDTAGFLEDKLGGTAVRFPARQKPRTHLGQSVVSTSGLAILTRLEVRTQTLDLVTDPRDGERIAALADLEIEGGLRILNLHLCHLGGELGRHLRAEQLAQALAWAEADWDGPLLVAGDLNARITDPELAPLAARGVHNADLGDTLLPGGKGSERRDEAIDHLVLIDPAGRRRILGKFLALNRPDETGLFPSDHAAVVMDIA